MVETAGVVPSQELLRGLEVALVSCLTSLDLHETKLEVSLSAFLSRSLSFAPSISLSLSLCLSFSLYPSLSLSHARFRSLIPTTASRVGLRDNLNSTIQYSRLRLTKQAAGSARQEPRNLLGAL